MHEPVLTISPGEVVSFAALECSDGQFGPGISSDTVMDFDWTRLYPMVGPILVEGAEPGDTVEIEFVSLELSESWGWSVVAPGMGLLTEDFPGPHLHHWSLGGAFADFLDVARIPVRPFLGVTGVCPDTPSPLPVIPPGHFGGNLDTRDLTVGSSLFLPVQVPGARLGLGDPHAAQGDGEVCGSAIEASVAAVARILLHKDKPIAAPQLRTTGPLRHGIEDKGYYATMGVAPDLMRAAQDAIRAMIEHLGREYGLAPMDAYVLCSVGVDLKISEVVDLPNWVVSAYLPLSIML